MQLKTIPKGAFQDGSATFSTRILSNPPNMNAGARSGLCQLRGRRRVLSLSPSPFVERHSFLARENVEISIILS